VDKHLKLYRTCPHGSLSGWRQVKTGGYSTSVGCLLLTTILLRIRRKFNIGRVLVLNSLPALACSR